MATGTHRSTRPRLRRALFPALLSVLVAVTGFEMATHGHVPAAAGWHDAVPHGPSSHDERLKSCSICRLAHETSVGTTAPLDVCCPDRVVGRPVPKCEARSLAVVARERSSRAPPSDGSC